MARKHLNPGKGEVSPERGFTAVELVVVLAIVGIVAAVAIPALNKTLRRSRFRSAAREIQTSLLAARMRAVRRNLPASVLVVTAAPSAPSHVLQTIEADTPAPTPTPQPAAQHPISAGSLVFLTLPAANKITFDGNGRRIVPPGPAADIVVEGPTGAGDRNQITIRTSLTGRVEVVTPTVWQ